MSKIKLHLEFTFDNGAYIQKEVIIADEKGLDEIEKTVRRQLYGLGEEENYLELVPYNKNPNADNLDVAFYISLKGLRSAEIEATVIKIDKPD